MNNSVTLSVDSKADSEWNDRLLTSVEGSISQSSTLAEYQKIIEGWNPIYLKFLNSENSIVGQIVLTFIPKFNKIKSFRYFSNMVNKKPALIRWAQGPVIFDHNYDKSICISFQNFLISKNSKVFGFPHSLNNDLFSNFTKSFNLKNWCTFLIDLKQDKKTIYSNMHKNSCQKNIQRSKKRGVYIKEISENDLPLIYNMKNDPVNNKPNLTLKKLKFRWKALRSLGYTGFLATHNEIPVGGIFISFFNKFINELGILRTTKDFEEKLYSQDLLKWQIIEWGKQNNMRFYDLSGANPNPSSTKEQGILNYKKKWGGNMIFYNVVEL